MTTYMQLIKKNGEKNKMKKTIAIFGILMLLSMSIAFADSPAKQWINPDSPFYGLKLNFEEWNMNRLSADKKAEYSLTLLEKRVAELDYVEKMNKTKFRNMSSERVNAELKRTETFGYKVSTLAVQKDFIAKKQMILEKVKSNLENDNATKEQFTNQARINGEMAQLQGVTLWKELKAPEIG